MVPRTSPAAGACCWAPGGGPLGFCADSETAARLRKRASSANKMRFMEPALTRGVGRSRGAGINPYFSFPHYGFDAPGFQKVGSPPKLPDLLFPSGGTQRIVELVGVFAGFDFDGHRAADSFQLSGPGVGNDRYHQRWRAAVHQTGMLQNERALASLQRAGDVLDRHVGRRVLDRSSASQHLTLGDPLEIAVVLLVERHSADHLAA